MTKRFYLAAAVIATSVCVLLFAVAAPAARAYSVNGQGPTSTIFSGLTAPFQNFIQSINTVNVPPVQISSVPQDTMAANWLQDAFQRFDTWLYGIAGFHIAGLFVAILNIFSWLLGIVKTAVDWLLHNI